MTEDQKLALKYTLAGLATGGTLAAINAIANSRSVSKKPKDGEFTDNEIVVPLSRSNFLKAVRPETLARMEREGILTKKRRSVRPKIEEVKQIENKATPSTEELGVMTPAELASLKRSILSKAASKTPDRICETVGKTVTERPVRCVSGINTLQPRDDKGRFTTEKVAFPSLSDILPDDSAAILREAAGFAGGTALGLYTIKKVTDMIALNRRKKQVEASRKMYSDIVSREVNDSDVPFYTKEGQAEDRGLFDSTVAAIAGAGLLGGGISGIIMYRIMENRRREEEKNRDKDLTSYPSDKVIKFQFPKEKAPRKNKDGFFR